VRNTKYLPEDACRQLDGPVLVEQPLAHGRRQNRRGIRVVGTVGFEIGTQILFPKMPLPGGKSIVLRNWNVQAKRPVALSRRRSKVQRKRSPIAHGSIDS
jgi:hypothetical protein